MIAVAPTDPNWFQLLREAEPEGELNFWTPTPWNIKGLHEGDRFYFLLKAPIRKIGGYGVFVRYENLSAREAWDKYGRRNGIQDLEELLERTKKYADKRAETERDGANPTIGCIVLRDSRFFLESQFVTPEQAGLDFSPTIVKLKYFDQDPLNGAEPADRSIRSIDIALRRRFEVFECQPQRKVLERFYAAGLGDNKVPSLFDGFDGLNERLTAELDRHHTIGHTFFMSPRLDVKRLRKVWERTLGPLIEEYFFDQPDLAMEFTPEQFWPELESE